MSRTSSLSTSILEVNPLHPCHNKKHARLKQHPRKADASPGVYRITCTRCGEWGEFNREGALLWELYT